MFASRYRMGSFGTLDALPPDGERAEVQYHCTTLYGVETYVEFGVPGFEGSDVVREVGDSVERFATVTGCSPSGSVPASTLSSLRGRAQAGAGVDNGSMLANADYDNGAALHD